MTHNWIMDYIVLIYGLLYGVAMWLMIGIDMIFIHKFVDIYKQLMIIASIFTITGVIIITIHKEE